MASRRHDGDGATPAMEAAPATARGRAAHIPDGGEAPAADARSRASTIASESGRRASRRRRPRRREGGVASSARQDVRLDDAARRARHRELARWSNCSAATGRRALLAEASSRSAAAEVTLSPSPPSGRLVSEPGTVAHLPAALQVPPASLSARGASVCEGVRRPPPLPRWHRRCGGGRRGRASEEEVGGEEYRTAISASVTGMPKSSSHGEGGHPRSSSPPTAPGAADQRAVALARAPRFPRLPSPAVNAAASFAAASFEDRLLRRHAFAATPPPPRSRAAMSKRAIEPRRPRRRRLRDPPPARRRRLRDAGSRAQAAEAAPSPPRISEPPNHLIDPIDAVERATVGAAPRAPRRRGPHRRDGATI